MASLTASASSSSAPQLDFEALLNRDYRPAPITRLNPQEAFHPELYDAGQKKNKKKNKNKIAEASMIHSQTRDRQKREAEEETSRLVLRLVAQTPGFRQHLPEHDRRIADTKNSKDASRLLAESEATTMQPQSSKGIPSAFHEIELGDWEKNIDWEGCTSTGAAAEKDGAAARNNGGSGSSGGCPSATAIALLKRPRNPHLDAIDFSSCLDASSSSSSSSRAAATNDYLAERARSAPLILELGVAGQSVARHVYQNTVLSAQRPTPALKSEEYRRRIERDWSQPITSTAEISKKGTLHADKEKMEALIQARQKKRAQMAKDKTTRVTEALGTVAAGGGRGRTITSSLMGPGGTERTGRPSRQMGSSAFHDAEYIEQLDMVTNHSLVRDLPKVLLREYHRPKLPTRVVRTDLSWQFQIRYAPTGKKAGGTSAGNASSYQAIMMGTHAGAVSKAKLRNEADLSPSEGKLVLMEYSEERPPIQLTKGMCADIINYYRGDKAHCPVSAGGGDRPARRKRAGADSSALGGKKVGQSGKAEPPPRLEGPNRQTTVIDWVGKLPKKSQKSQSEKETIDVLPEGKTEILHPKVHGPFIGEVEEGVTQSGLISNMFVAPIFRHDPESTDFLMILGSPGGQSRPGERESMRVVLRNFPKNIYAVGQTEPRTRVNAPGSQGEKSFSAPFVSYQIARALTRTQAREGHGLRFDEIGSRVFPYMEIQSNALRQRLKQVAIYDKNTQIWTTKAIGYEDYMGVDALGKSISPEGVAAFETACAAARRLRDLGIHKLFQGSLTVGSVGVTMIYLAGQLNNMREVARKMKNLEKMSRSSKNIPAFQVKMYEKAAAEVDSDFKSLRQKHEVASFIYEQLQLAPWHLTGEFIEVHKKAEGTGMMKLTGLGDPSGQGWAFSFLREIDSKPSKSVGTGDDELGKQIKKITGTQDDLRKLTMKQMAQLLRNYGMPEAKIATLKRWDRVHVIRDLSTKAASDGIGDGLERFARGEKMKLSEQKEMYRKRMQLIWNRQIESLSSDSGDKATGTDGGVASADGGPGSKTAPQSSQSKKGTGADGVDSDDDSDDDDFAEAFEDEMMNRSEGNELLAAHTRSKESEVGLGQLRAAAQDQDLSKEARELAALKKQREEERTAQEGWQSARPEMDSSNINPNRKVIRKRVTKTYPDGRQTITFKFIVQHEEVGQVMARLQNAAGGGHSKKKSINYDQGNDDKMTLPGHSMFEDDDDFEYSSKSRLLSNKRRGVTRRRGPAGGRATPRPRNNLQFGKLKTKTSKEDRKRKLKREEEELEVYQATSRRKGTNNRRERGSIRDRRPHVIFAEKLERIRATVEGRDGAGPFIKPVNRKLLPRYYEIISHPIDLQTMKEKISRYDYRTADALVKDFELMKSNAVKFNGLNSAIALEAIAIYDFVRDQVESSRDELTALEEAVKEQMSGKPKKKKKQGGSKKSSGASNMASVGGVDVNLGDLSQQMLEGINSDSDESIAS